MAELQIEDSELVLHLSSVEKMEGLHGDLRVPLVAVILRRGYGLGAQAMTGGSLHEPLLTVAWPGAHLGPMGLEGAVRLALRKELEAIADEGEREQRVRELTVAAEANAAALNASAEK